MHFSQTVLLGLAALGAAHPGHEEEERRHLLNTRAMALNTKRGIQSCASKLDARGFYEEAALRRKSQLEQIRRERGFDVDAPFRRAAAHSKRSTASVANTTHYQDIDVGAALGNPDYIFSETECTVLNPQGEVGPFYVLGEHVHSDLREDQAGVDMIVDLQVLDVVSCQPLSSPGTFVDIWNANSTGVYGGVQSSMNQGNADDASNLNRTSLRGIQPLDPRGVAQFTTKFPGHYAGRATHMHIIVHNGAQMVAENGTITEGNIPHVGQLFWDQDLISEVEALSPYTENDAELTLNVEDHVFGEQETEGTTSDPVFNYAYINGDEADVADGLFVWAVLAVNSTASYNDAATYSFALTEHGGVAVENGGGGQAPGGGVSGAPPTGSMPTSTATASA